MAGRRNMASSVLSAVIGCTFATLACFVYFNYVAKSKTPAESPDKPAPTPVPTREQEIPNPELRAADITSVGIDTVYKGYFAPGDKCAKNYNEYFGNSDSYGSASSPCTLRMEVNRDGTATRSIDIQRWDAAAKAYKEVERSEFTASVTTDQFNEIVRSIAANEMFKDWSEGPMVNVRNTSITAKHTGGLKTVMSNVDETTTAYMPMVDAFRKLEKQLAWKRK